ncbi:MAG TPA: metal ABC transporter permease [Azospirillaceae bacterium]|nr:metal ABC transporter permease [Azospirillaceae bacterium]
MTLVEALGGWNSAVVLAGTAALGVAAGTVGVFLLLRRRSLVSDALSHATLPGIAIAFMVGAWLGIEGRSLPLLLAGAAASGALGVVTIQAISRHTRLPEDAAIGAVLSVFFGLGVVLLSYVQTLPSGGQAGIKTFILGQTAAMRAGEATALGALALAAVAMVLLFFKELRLLAFDQGFAQVQGWPAARLDLLLMALVTLVTVVGLQTVGLILIIALLITPAAAARFWTDRLGLMTLISAVLGGLSGGIGAFLSARFADLPAGAVIVLVAASLFLLSFLFAPARGVVARVVRHGLLRLRLAESEELAAIAGGQPHPNRPLSAWLRLRGFTGSMGKLTMRGRIRADAALRNRLLWNRFIERYPAQLPGITDWGLAPIDRVLPPDLVRELEAGR